jgi:ABC-type transport system substrate-binding protein
VRSRRFAVAFVVLVVALGVSLGAAGAGVGAPGGEVVRAMGPLDPGPLDPALARPLNAPLFYWTCATLQVFADAPAPAGKTVVPEAAAGPPQVSSDGLTYVFTVRPGLRFSDGSALTAANFARALGRVRDPAMGSPGAWLFSDVREVTASGLRLRITLIKPSGDLLMRLALPYACPVPLGFPIDPAGVDLSVGSGPYYVSQYVPGASVEVSRNPYYRGMRPRRVEGLTLTVGGDLNSDISAVENGQADVLWVTLPGQLIAGLVQRYGVNGSQLFRISGVETAALVLNTSSPLFKDNVALRQAVNFAIDRTALVEETPAGYNTPTDQVMPSWVPGWRNYGLYPLSGPDRVLARQLARGNLRSGTAVLWAIPGYAGLAQVIANELSAIGLQVSVTVMAVADFNARAGIPGAQYDMLLAGFPLDYPDPADALTRQLGGEYARGPSGNNNLAYFDDPVYNQAMAAADRLSGTARLEAFSRLDAEIMRNQAPWAPLFEESRWYLISSQLGCFQLHPVFIFDLPTVCLH